MGGRKHPELGLVTCEFDKFVNCRSSFYSQKQVDRHDYYMHKKVEHLPENMPKAEELFIRNGIPVFQNYEGIEMPEGTKILKCPYKPCYYETPRELSLKGHMKIYHEDMDFEKFMTETV